MGIESGLWKYLKRGMTGRWDAQRHEDETTPGIPDVSFGLKKVQGWIELKALDSWPARDRTPVRFKHLTEYQRRWLKKRGEAGGRCWLFVRVERMYLLIHWSNVQYVGELPREDLINLAHASWHGSVDWDSMEVILECTE